MLTNCSLIADSCILPEIDTPGHNAIISNRTRAHHLHSCPSPTCALNVPGPSRPTRVLQTFGVSASTFEASGRLRARPLSALYVQPTSTPVPSASTRALNVPGSRPAFTLTPNALACARAPSVYVCAEHPPSRPTSGLRARPTSMPTAERPPSRPTPGLFARLTSMLAPNVLARAQRLGCLERAGIKPKPRQSRLAAARILFLSVVCRIRCASFTTCASASACVLSAASNFALISTMYK